jgi:hypothetical protein
VDAEDVLELIGNCQSCSINSIAWNAELDRGGVGGHGVLLLDMLPVVIDF